MSSRSSTNRAYHQDYIVRIRYQNTLPPPACPPKLLDVPNNAAAQYTDTAFASRLARAEPLNVEADSELGMPLDLIHVSRVFEGDDSVIRPMDPPPPVDPRDRALLRPATSLGKTNLRASGTPAVSFLRRTEYISSEQSKSTFKGSNAERIGAKQRTPRQRKEEVDPLKILAAIMKGFYVANPGTAQEEAVISAAATDKAAANAERNWKELRHPLKPHLRAVETYPLVPDLNKLQGTEVGGYMVFRFTTAPTDRDMTEVKTRDERIDTAILRPTERVDGGPTDTSFDLHMPDSDETSRALKRKFETYSEDSPEEDDSEAVRLPHLRRYETKTKVQYNDVKHQPLEEIAFTLHKGDKTAGERNSAMYYPVLGRYSLRPKRRTKYIPGIGGGDEEDELVPNVDELRVKLRGLTEEEKKATQRLVPIWEGKQVEGGQQDGGVPPSATQESQDAEAEVEAEAEADGEEDAPGESDDGN